MLPPVLTATRTQFASLLLAATVYAAAIGIAAAAPEIPIASAQLEVDANPGCTTRADVVARVRARSPRVRFIDNGGALAIRAQFSTTQSGAVAGDITLASPGAKSSVRHVVARSCSEAADAVALIIAVTLDPTSVEQHERAATTEATPAASSAGNATESANEDTTSAQTPSTLAQNRPLPASPAAGPPGANEAARSRGRGTYGAELAAQSFLGPAPGVMPGVALYATAAIDRPAIWSPAVTLGVSHAWRTGIEERGGTASFTLDATSFDACPVRFRLGSIHARPCGSVLIGRLSARGTDTHNPASERARPFWVVGGAAILTADLTWPLEVSARFAVGANLLRDSFEFAPVVFHTVPAITASASLGLGVRWR